MADVAAAPTPAVVAGHLEALNLTGLGYAVKRLLGKDPLPVTNQFAMWARQDREGLPSVTRAYWAALAPLTIGRPQSPAAAVCDQVLRGRERDHQVALKAAAECTTSGKQQFRPLPVEVEDGSADALRRKALTKVVKDFWRTLGALYGEVRPPVVAGDHAAASAVVRGAEPELRRIIEQVAVLAAGVAGQAVQDTAAVQDLEESQPLDAEAAAIAAMARDEVVEEPLGGEAFAATYVEGEPTGPIARAGAGAEAFARRERLRDEAPAVAPRRVEVISTKPVRTRWAAPIIFLLVVAGLALYVIFSVLNAPNPLAT